MPRRDRPDEVIRAHSVGELSTLLAAKPHARLLGGGTHATATWREQGWPSTVVDLTACLELTHISPSSVGAAARLADIARSPHVPTALCQAAKSVGGPAVRAMATVGGNVAIGQPGCLAVALLALDASVKTISATDEGARWDELHDHPGLGTGVMLSFLWSEQQRQWSAFTKVALRTTGGPNIASVAIHLHNNPGRLGIRIAVGSTGFPPHRLVQAEQAFEAGEALGQKARLAGAAAAEEVHVRADRVAGAAYRRQVTGVLVRRLTTRLLLEAEGVS